MDATAVRKNFIDADVYAKQVVTNVLRKSPIKRQWAGGVANLIWLVSVLLWSTAWVREALLLYYKRLTGSIGLPSRKTVWDK